MKNFIISVLFFSTIITSCSSNIKSQFEDCYSNKISPIELLQNPTIKERIVNKCSQQYYEKLLTNTDTYSSTAFDSAQNYYYIYTWKNKRYNTSDNVQLRYYIDKDSLATTLYIGDLEIDKSGDSDYLNWQQVKGSPESVKQEFINSLKQKAEQGKATAQYLLGICYIQGIGVEVDIDKAIELYKKSKKQNNSQAIAALGFVYALSKNDQEHSMYYFNIAANQGNIDALRRLINDRLFFNKDYEQGIKWFKRLAEQDLEETLALGRFYIGELGFLNEDFKQRSDKEALKYFTLAAKENSGEANYWIANIYSVSKQIPHDFTKALEYYQKSANQGYTKAQLKLGEAYVTGNTGLVNRDIYKSLEWFRKAAEQNNQTAKYAMVAILENKLTNLGGNLEEMNELKKWKREIETPEISYNGVLEGNMDDLIIDKEFIRQITISLQQQ